jgi:hypothetical protein
MKRLIFLSQFVLMLACAGGAQQSTYFSENFG